MNRRPSGQSSLAQFTCSKQLATLVLGSALGLACASNERESLGFEQQAASTPFANDQKAFDYFLGKGLTSFQAAAVVGNLDQESGIDPTIHQNNGGVGRGIAQWSTGAGWDTTPGDDVLEYAKQQGKSELSLDLQLDFVWYARRRTNHGGRAAQRRATEHGRSTWQRWSERRGHRRDANVRRSDERLRRLQHLSAGQALGRSLARLGRSSGLRRRATQATALARKSGWRQLGVRH